MPSIQSSCSEIKSAESNVGLASSLSALVPPTSHESPSLGNACASSVSVSGHDSGLVSNPGEVSSVHIDGCDDVGLLLGSIPQAIVCKLSPEEKYSLLTNHFKPGPTYKFPSRPLDGCNRACQYKYL